MVRFFTQWGMFTTTITAILAIFNEAPASRRNKYGCFQVWKWHTFFFQVSLLFELIITPFFWLLLFRSLPPKSWFLGSLGETADHSLPLFCLLVEYLFCGCSPFVRRQFPFVVLIAVCYLSINLTYSLKDRPPYAIMSWKGVVGIIVPIGTIVFGFMVLFAMEWVTKKKLRRLGHDKVVNIMEGQRFKKIQQIDNENQKIEA